jgi:TolA-binding protein
MSRAKKILLVVVVAALGAWGCARGPAGNGASAERLKSVEGKYTKLQEENKAVVASRDLLRRKVAELESRQAKAEQEIREHEELSKERDELRQQVRVRTQERDSVQTQFEQLRKAIRGVLTQADAAASVSSPRGPNSF